MPAKAMVPVDALPCIHRFRGHGPLLQGPSLRSRRRWVNAPPCATKCRSGPWPRKRWFRLKRFLASPLSGPWAPPTRHRRAPPVARESQPARWGSSGQPSRGTYSTGRLIDARLGHRPVAELRHHGVHRCEHVHVGKPAAASIGTTPGCRPATGIPLTTTQFAEIRPARNVEGKRNTAQREQREPRRSRVVRGVREWPTGGTLPTRPTGPTSRRLPRPGIGMPGTGRRKARRTRHRPRGSPRRYEPRRGARAPQ
jgi:hypothetical protein